MWPDAGNIEAQGLRAEQTRQWHAYEEERSGHRKSFHEPRIHPQLQLFCASEERNSRRVLTRRLIKNVDYHLTPDAVLWPGKSSRTRYCLLEPRGGLSATRKEVTWTYSRLCAEVPAGVNSRDTGFWEVSVRCGCLWLMLRQGSLTTSFITIGEERVLILPWRRLAIHESPRTAAGPTHSCICHRCVGP